MTLNYRVGIVNTGGGRILETILLFPKTVACCVLCADYRVLCVYFSVVLVYFVHLLGIFVDEKPQNRNMFLKCEL